MSEVPCEVLTAVSWSKWDAVVMGLGTTMSWQSSEVDVWSWGNGGEEIPIGGGLASIP
ncbi:unnamed protein product [Prunus armeniaca]|uniref:Uncharacterized protein n=1 Tax=Prunus armeniaca TaxID=36596 RepID=A0A6J5WCN9_PRUAR|nr:unnamed protein product [Prunus armeniaca]